MRTLYMYSKTYLFSLCSKSCAACCVSFVCTLVFLLLFSFPQIKRRAKRKSERKRGRTKPSFSLTELGREANGNSFSKYTYLKENTKSERGASSGASDCWKGCPYG